MEKEKARKARAKDLKEARACSVRKDTRLQMNLHLRKKEKRKIKFRNTRTTRYPLT